MLQYEILQDGAKLDEAIKAENVVLPLSKLVGLQFNEDGSLLLEQPVLDNKLSNIIFVKEQYPKDYNEKTLLYNIILKPITVDKEVISFKVKIVESREYGEVITSTIVDTEVYYKSNKDEFYIDFTGLVCYRVNNDDVENEAEVLDDVQELYRDPRVVAYHSKSEKNIPGWGTVLAHFGIEEEQSVPVVPGKLEEEPIKELVSDPEKAQPVQPEAQPSSREDKSSSREEKVTVENKVEAKEEPKKKSKLLPLACIALFVIIVAGIVAYEYYN